MEATRPTVDRTLAAGDYVIFGLMLVISLLIGIFYAIKDRRSSKGTDGYLMAGRTMSAIPAGISLAVSFQSSITVLGIPNDVYLYGITYLWTLVSMVLTFFVVSYLFLPILYNLKISSAYEYLDMRFHRYVRLLTTSLYLITNLLYMGVNIYGPALFLSGATSIDLISAMLSTGLICAIYTALGGLRGVIWTDVFQGVIMLVGMLSVIIRGSALQGGFTKVIEIASTSGRTSANYNTDGRMRYTFFSITLGMLVTWVGIFGTNQAQVQRLLSVKTRREAKIALGVGIAGICIYTALAILCGLVASSYYGKCDPRLAGCVKKPDELYPFAVFNIFHSTPGLTGVFLACVFSGSLSTVSSGVNSMVTVVMADFIKPYTNWSERVYIWIAKGATFLCGCCALGIGIAASVAGDIVKLGLGSITAFIGPCLGVFLLGILFSFVNTWGALSGILCGFVSGFTMFFGSTTLKRPYHLHGFLNFTADKCPSDCDFSMGPNITYVTISQQANSTYIDELHGIKNFYALSVYYQSLVTVVVTIVVGISVSLLTCGWKKRDEVDKKLTSPSYEANLPAWATNIDQKSTSGQFE